MENKFQTSFIPKKSLEDTGKVKVSTPFSILFLIATIIVIVAIAASGILFGYSLYLKKQIMTVQDEVATKAKALDESKINNIVRVNNKLQAATNLLNSHTSVSGIFSFLSDNTLKNLRFNNFQFSYLSPTRVTVSMKGQTKSFGAVEKQSEVFSSNSAKKYFADPVFSDLNLDAGGNVTFSFLASIDPSLVSYVKTLSASEKRAGAPLTPPAVASSTSTASGSSTNEITP